MLHLPCCCCCCDIQCDICLEDALQIDMLCARGSHKRLAVQDAKDGCRHFSCQACMQVGTIPEVGFYVQLGNPQLLMQPLTAHSCMAKDSRQQCDFPIHSDFYFHAPAGLCPQRHRVQEVRA